MAYNSKSRKRNIDSENYNWSKKRKSVLKNKHEYKDISKKEMQELIEEELMSEDENEFYG